MVKLCSDYASHPVMIDGDNSISGAVCRIMEYYIDTEIADQSRGWYYSSEDRLGQFLTIVYRLAGSSKEWLKGFFVLVKGRYLSENQEECRWADDIAGWTFENVYPALAMHAGEDLCDLADCVFFEEGRKHTSYFSNMHSQALSYGLSNNADRLRFSRNDTFKYFLINLFKTDFVTGLDWALRFTNRAVSCFAEKSPEQILNIPIFFPEKNEPQSYYGNGEMWLCRAEEHRVPTIISDIVYHTKNGLIEYLEFYKRDQKLFQKLGEWIKTEIYSKSNNIAMLSVIQEIGFHFQDELPGYALELSSSYELLHFDIPRYLLFHPNPTKKLLEKQILQIAGIPELEQRYELDDLCDCSFQEYVLKIQLSADTFSSEKAIKIIDYLYSLVDSGTYDTSWKLQAQKMDLRNSSIKDLGNAYYEISVSMPENNNAKVPEKQVAHKEEAKLNQEIARIIQQVNTGTEYIDYNHVDALINKVLESINKDELWRIQHEEILVQLIVVSLYNKNISADRRDYLCSIWASGIRKLFNNNSFVTNIEWIPILYKQLDQELSYETQNLIKGIMLDSLIDESNNGQIRKISDYTYRYLLTNECLTHNMFTTIIMLAEDEMNHQRYNAEYWQKKKGDGEFQFVPNMQRHLTHIDYYLNDHMETSGYISNQEEIIQKFLFDEEAFDFSNFELDNYDVRTLCHAANCGLTLQDDQFFAVIKQIILCIIEMEHQSDYNGSASEILGIDAKLDVIELLQREIGGGQDSFAKVLQLLFENVEFNKFTRNTSEFYLQILCCLIAQYFDAYQNAGLRGDIERKIKNLEARILAIENNTVKTELTQAAALIDSKFYSDWSKCPTAYSDKDKIFLNQQYGKYGHFHFRDFILTLYQMHIRELLPEVLISVETVFANSKEADLQEFYRVISKQQSIVNRMILDAYVYYSDAIKRDAELSNAYIHILEMLIAMNNEKAAVLLDEFLIH